jgi:cysteine desulfurase
LLKPSVVSIMLANNETGVIQPTADVAALIRPTGALLHVDAAQAAGKIPIDCKALGADLLSVSAHKLGGPPGCGALIVRPGLEPPALLQGGAQERRRRAGTENIVGIAGFGAAAAASAASLAEELTRCTDLRNGFEAAVRAASAPAVIYGADASRLPGTSCVGLATTPSETQLMYFDLAGVAVSAGAACSSGKVTASHVLLAMGADPAAAGCAVRVSFGWNSSAADAQQLTAAWTTLAARDAGRQSMMLNSKTKAGTRHE